MPCDDARRLSNTVEIRGAAGEGAKDGIAGEETADTANDPTLVCVEWPDLPDLIEIVSDGGVASSTMMGRRLLVDEEGTGFRIDIPRFPKTLFAVRRRLGGFTGIDGTCPTGGGSLSFGPRSPFPFPHHVPTQSPMPGRSWRSFCGTIVASPDCSSSMVR